MNLSILVDNYLNSNANILAKNGNKIGQEEYVREFFKISQFLVKSKPKNLRIGILLNYDYHFYLTILASLKNNITFVPLDPNWPGLKISEMIKEAELSLILDETLLKEILKNPIGQSTSFYENSFENKMAYIIFTTGSTGKPKGTQISRDSLGHYFNWLKNTFNKTPPKNLLFSLDFTFDMIMINVGLALLFYSEIKFPKNKENLFELINDISNFEIDTIVSVPSFLNLLCHDRFKGILHSGKLKNLIIGGSVFPLSIYNILKQNKKINTFNIYGPTETTVSVNHCLFDWSEQEVSQDFITIGRPSSGNEFLLLSGEKKITSPNQLGELLISGPQLMEGYLKEENPEKNNFILINGKTFFKTKDLCFFNESGYFFITGRNDETIKRKGYRINLAGLDHKICTHSDISESCSIALTEKNKEIKIITYFVSKKEISISAITKYLRNLLSDFELPDYYIQLDSIPLNQNGKYDKKNLLGKWISQ